MNEEKEESVVDREGVLRRRGGQWSLSSKQGSLLYMQYIVLRYGMVWYRIVCYGMVHEEVIYLLDSSRARHQSSGEYTSGDGQCKFENFELKFEFCWQLAM